MVEAAGTTPLMVHAAGDTHIGGREHNEDAILLRPDLDLYLVADGAGGHNAGHIASALATTAAAHYYESTQDSAADAPVFDEMGLSWAARRLASAFQRANREVRETSEFSERCTGMGTTLVAAHFDLENATLVLGHVGDSRCYRLRGNHLERLTQDHTLINDVLEIEPDIAPERARALPRNVITNALGMEDRVRVSVRTHEIIPGDRFVLCSDGLTDGVDDGQIQQALALGSTPAEVARLMIDLALDSHSRDNVAVIVLACQVAPGIGRLPRKPVPPTRHDARAAAKVKDNTDTEEFEAEEFEARELPSVEIEPGAFESQSVEVDAAFESEEVEILHVDDIDNGILDDTRGSTDTQDESTCEVDDELDDPEVEIVMTERAAEQERRRRDDDTVITKND